MDRFFMTSPKIIAYLKPSCGWSNGVRAVLSAHGLQYEDRDIINGIGQRAEMERKSGQKLSPCVEVNGQMLADISGEELEAWLLENGMLETKAGDVGVPTNSACKGH